MMVTRASLSSTPSFHHFNCCLFKFFKHINQILRPSCNSIARRNYTSPNLPQFDLISTPKVVAPRLLFAVNSCSSISQCQIILTELIKRGSYSDGFVGDQLVGAYAKTGSVSDALKLFDEIPNKDLVSWNSIISVFSRDGDVEKCLSLFHRMRRELGVNPNEVTLISVLPVCADMQALNEGKFVHVYAVKLGFLSETKVVNSLISMYGKCQVVNAACKLFEDMVLRNLVSWNSMIAVYVHNGVPEEGVKCFNLMRKAGFKPDRASIVSVLQVFGDLAAVRPGRAIHGCIVVSGFTLDVPITTALISVYSKSGSLDTSVEVFVEMNNPDRIAWTAMLAGYAMHGLGKEAIDCFSLMIKEGMRPDHVTFTHVLNACSHSGLVKEGKTYFQSMQKIYGVTPRIDHYSCMVDLLGRAGFLREAHDLIKSMPIEPNAGVWGALIGACRVQHDIEFGKEVAEKLFAIDPSDPRNYIILSNMYSAAGQWKDASHVRALMKKRGLKKDPGCSSIEHAGKVHCFVVGDQSHSMSTKIYEKLGELIVKIQIAGYVPNTEFVLHDVDEDVKEDMIYKHSEKLAVAFGLLVNSPSIPIMITNNLRICGDCHSAAKFISLTEQRSIVVRDSKRFHHFANGLCSCRDYW